MSLLLPQGIRVPQAPPPTGTVYGDTMDTPGAVADVPLSGDIDGPLRAATGPEGGWNYTTEVFSGGNVDGPLIDVIQDAGNGGFYGQASGRQACWAPDLGTTDHWVEFTVPVKGVWAGGGVVMLGVDPDNCFLAGQASTGSGNLRFYAITGGSLSKKGQNITTIDGGTLIRMEFSGVTVAVYANGLLTNNDDLVVDGLAGTKCGTRQSQAFGGAYGLFGQFRCGPMPYVAP